MPGLTAKLTLLYAWGMSRPPLHYYDVAPLTHPRQELYTYASHDVLVKGQVVRITLGTRQLPGVVWAEAAALPRARLLETVPIILPETAVAVAEMITTEYLTSLGITLKAFLNNGVIQKLTAPPFPSAPPPPGCKPQVLITPRPSDSYRQAVQAAHQTGRSALLIVPTPADAVRWQETFGPPAALYTSTIAPAARATLWNAVAAREVPLLVGTRSALLLPWNDLGVVILDDEDDMAFKQDQAPRYHARTVAHRLAELSGAAFLIGTPAPSLETYRQVADGRYAASEAASRGRSSTVPPPKGRELISYELEQAIRSGSHVVLYAPQRFLEALGRELAKKFPDRSAKRLNETMDNPAAIQYGAQPITRATVQAPLVGALQADALLQLPDFRAAEKAHAVMRRLLARTESGGRLLIQTATADHPAWTSLGHPFAVWSDSELPERRALGLPPYARLTRLLFTDTKAVGAELQARAAETAIRTNGGDASASVCPIPESGGRHRWQVLYKGDPKAIRPLLQPDWKVDVDPVNLL